MTAQLWNRATLVFAAIGMFVAGVMTVSFYAGRDVQCGFGSGCNAVSSHPAAQWFGIPVAVFGLVAYTALFALGALRAAGPRANWRMLSNISMGITGIGFVMSMYLMFVMLTEVRQLCTWCMGSAVTMLLSLISTALMAQADAPEGTEGGMDLSLIGALAVLAIGATGAQVAMSPASKTAAPVALNERLKLEDVLPDASKVKGDASAPITIVEFADYVCPACRKAAIDLQPMLDQHSGKIRFAYRNLPLYQLEGHEQSANLALVSEYAASKGKFWDFFAAVMAESSNEYVKSFEGVLSISRMAGLDTNEVQRILDEKPEDLFNKVADDTVAAQQFGVQGTPTFIVFAEGQRPMIVNSRQLVDLLNQPEYQALLNGGPSA